MELRLNPTRLSRIRKPSLFQALNWTLPETWAGSRLLFLGWILALVLLAFLPVLWIERVSARELDAWFEVALPQAERVTQAFCSTVDPGPLGQGDEPGVIRLLAENPLNYAVVDPDAGRILVREGNRLVPMPPGTEREVLVSWAIRARGSGKMTWSPEVFRSDLRSASYTLVPEPSGVVVVKRWVPGSPEGDAFLDKAMVGQMPIRFGLIATSSRTPPPAWMGLPGRINSFQVRDLKGPEPFRYALGQRRSYGDWFVPVVAMPPRVYRDHLRIRKLRATIAWGVYGFGAALSGSLLLLLARAQARRQMDSRRLAALAHSLKTPLAMMKVRCDSAMNANLSRERQVAHLMRVGDGVEKLLHIIEHGLEPFRVQSTRRGATNPDAFFRDLEAEFRPAFEELGRKLEVSSGPEPIRASAASLRSALSILVENALLHGGGTVRLTCRSVAGHTQVQVQDEGSGIAPERLAVLDRPGSYAPDPAATAIGTSQGLGLALLLALVRREGWGLLVDNPDGEGFGVRIEIPR